MSYEKMVRPAARREVARYLQQRYEVRERRPCRTIAFSRATLRCRSHVAPNELDQGRVDCWVPQALALFYVRGLTKTEMRQLSLEAGRVD